MPTGMLLKSDGFASNLSAAKGAGTLAAFCADRGIDYHDTRVPVSLDVFVQYAMDFQERFVPDLDGRYVSAVDPSRDGFSITLDDGETLSADFVWDGPRRSTAGRPLRTKWFLRLRFILTDTGEAELLEVNPRVSPTAHLLVEGGNLWGRTFTLFPPAPVSTDRRGAPLVGDLDVPARAPWLVRRGEAEAARDRRRFTRWRKERLARARR